MGKVYFIGLAIQTNKKQNKFNFMKENGGVDYLMVRGFIAKQMVTRELCRKSI